MKRLMILAAALAFVPSMAWGVAYADGPAPIVTISQIGCPCVIGEDAVVNVQVFSLSLLRRVTLRVAVWIPSSPTPTFLVEGEDVIVGRLTAPVERAISITIPVGAQLGTYQIEAVLLEQSGLVVLSRHGVLIRVTK